jgi:hypothetical protein
MLMDMATLSTIALITDDGQGNMTELNYGLSPLFVPRSLNYRNYIPRDASRLVITGLPHDGENVAYRIHYRGAKPGAVDPLLEDPADYVDYDFQNSDGVFLLPPEVKYFTLSLTVNRENRFTTVYTVQAIRKQPPWLTNIEVKTISDINGVPTPGTHNFPLDPGFDSNILDYDIGVNYNAVAFTVTPSIRTQDNANITVEFSDAVIPDAGGTAEYPFPWPGMNRRTVTITVRNPEEDPQPLIYRLNIIRPEQIMAANPAKAANFIVKGNGLNGYFSKGELVAFEVKPPFGYRAVNIVARNAVTGRSIPFDSSDEVEWSARTFYMPAERVYLDARWDIQDRIPRSPDTNVRYVWDYNGDQSARPLYGQNEDGMYWATATRDLQGLMDNFDPTPGAPNNYEIWIAEGTYEPDWTRLSSRALTTWAKDLTAAHRENPLYWSFVLTEGVKIYGGFAGTEETQGDKTTRKTRWNPSKGIVYENETILSGDTGERKCYRVMIAAGINFALVDGVTLLSAFNVMSYTGNIPVNNKNIAVGTGGTLYVIDASPLLRNTTLSYAFTQHASCMAVWGTSNPVLINCNFDHSQSSGYSSGIGLRSAAAGLTMVGGTLASNWDAGGVVHIAEGKKSVFVNVTIKDNLEHAIFDKRTSVVGATGNGIFVNLTVTNNLGSAADSHYTIQGASMLYNCVVKDNIGAYASGTHPLQPSANVDSGGDTTKPTNKATLADTIAPGHPDSIPDGTYVDRGSNTHYPLDPSGDWNTASPVYQPIVDAVTNPEALAAIKEALAKDGRGYPRFKDGTINLGALEE